MTPEAQRIAIAEICGLKPPFKLEQGVDGKEWQARKTVWTIPNYLADLNDMHEAEKVLKEPMEYCKQLAAVVYRPSRMHTRQTDSGKAGGLFTPPPPTRRSLSPHTKSLERLTNETNPPIPNQ